MGTPLTDGTAQEDIEPVPHNVQGGGSNETRNITQQIYKFSASLRITAFQETTGAGNTDYFDRRAALPLPFVQRAASQEFHLFLPYDGEPSLVHLAELRVLLAQDSD